VVYDLECTLLKFLSISFQVDSIMASIGVPIWLVLIFWVYGGLVKPCF